MHTLGPECRCGAHGRRGLPQAEALGVVAQMESFEIENIPDVVGIRCVGANEGCKRLFGQTEHFRARQKRLFENILQAGGPLFEAPREPEVGIHVRMRPREVSEDAVNGAFFERNLLFVKVFDVTDFRRGEKYKGVAFGVRSRSPAHPMDVIRHGCGRIVLDNPRHFGQIQASGTHIRAK